MGLRAIYGKVETEDTGIIDRNVDPKNTGEIDGNFRQFSSADTKNTARIDGQ